MRTAIENFAKQFAYNPEVENGEGFLCGKRPIMVGMGGSHLAGDLLKTWKPEIDITIHRDYGLPKIPDAELQNRLVILSSYSGNTEEVLDAYDEVRRRGLPMAAISVGGKLAARSRADRVPFVALPDTGIQPRAALGFSFRAILKILGREEELRETSALAKILNPQAFEPEGRELAAYLKNKVPVIYASQRNESIVYNWKIKLNETGKIPAFCNVLPELNHNEMTGFDVRESTRALSNIFSFIILRHPEDHPQVRKRMAALKKLYEDRDLAVKILELAGATYAEAIFRSLLLADWTAVYIAEGYGLEAEQVPMVEEFKKMISAGWSMFST